MAESGATAVFWNRRYEPAAVARDSQLKSKLREHGLLAESFNGSLLFEPCDDSKPERTAVPDLHGVLASLSDQTDAATFEERAETPALARELATLVGPFGTRTGAGGGLGKRVS